MNKEINRFKWRIIKILRQSLAKYCAKKTYWVNKMKDLLIHWEKYGTILEFIKFFLPKPNFLLNAK
jgi:hypothetical protein